MFLIVLCLSESCPRPHGLDGTAVPNLCMHRAVHPPRQAQPLQSLTAGGEGSPHSPILTTWNIPAIHRVLPQFHPWDTRGGLLLLLQEAAELLSGQVHEPIHLLLGAFEVLNAEGINCHLPNAQVQAPPQRLQQDKMEQSGQQDTAAPCETFPPGQDWIKRNDYQKYGTPRCELQIHINEQEENVIT